MRLGLPSLVTSSAYLLALQGPQLSHQGSQLVVFLLPQQRLAISQDKPHASIICFVMAEHRIHFLSDLLILHRYYYKAIHKEDVIYRDSLDTVSFGTITGC